MILQPRFGIFQQERLFTPNTELSCLMHQHLQIKLKSSLFRFTTLFCYTVRETVYRVLTAVNMGGGTIGPRKYKYLYQQLATTEHTIFVGATSHTIRFSLTQKRPYKVLVLFVKQACHAGNYTRSPTSRSFTLMYLT